MSLVKARIAPFLWALLLSCFLLLSHRSSIALAAPTERVARGSGPLYNVGLEKRKDDKDKPDYPDNGRCDEAIRENQPPKDQSIFFTGLDNNTMNDVKEYAEGHSLTHVTDWRKGHQIWKPAGFPSPGNYKRDEDKLQRFQVKLRRFQKDFAKTYAEHTSGTAYLMMGKDKKPKKDSIFYSVEFKAMKDSGDVDKIIWLDIDKKPDDPTDITDIWWTKGDDDPETDSAEVVPEDEDVGTSNAPEPMCDLGNYPAPNTCPLSDGVAYLGGKDTPNKYCAQAKQCALVSCFFGTGISLCNDSDAQYCMAAGDIAAEVATLQGSCDPNYDNFLTNCDDPSPTGAMQQFGVSAMSTFLASIEFG